MWRLLSFLQALWMLSLWLHTAAKYKAAKTHLNFAAKILPRAYNALAAGAESRLLWVARTGQ